MRKSTLFNCILVAVIILSITLLAFAVTGLFVSALTEQLQLEAKIYLSCYSLILIAEVFISLLVTRYDNYYLLLMYGLVAFISIYLKVISPINSILGPSLSLFSTFIELMLIILITPCHHTKQIVFT